MHRLCHLPARDLTAHPADAALAASDGVQQL
jgi:hypothetical protein